MDIKLKDKDDMITFLRLLRMRTDTRIKTATEDGKKIYGALFLRALEVLDRVLVNVNDLSEEQLETFIDIIKDLDYAHTPGTKAQPLDINLRAEVIRDLFNRLELFANTLPEEEKVEFQVGDKVQLTPKKIGEDIPFPSKEVRREGAVIEDNSRLEPIVISRKSETPRVEQRFNNPSRDETRVKKSAQKVETTNNPSRDRFVSLDEHGRGYTEYNIVDGRLVPPQVNKTQVVIAAHSSQEKSQTQDRYTIPEFMRTSPSPNQSLKPLLGTKRIVENNPQSEKEQMEIYANKIGRIISSFRDDDLLEQHNYMFDSRDYKEKPYWRERIPSDMIVRYEMKTEKFIRDFSRLSSRLTSLSKKVVEHITATYGKVDDIFTMKTVYDYLVVIYRAKAEVKKLYKSVKNFDMMNTALTSATSLVSGVEMYFYDQEMPGIKDNKGVSKS